MQQPLLHLHLTLKANWTKTRRGGPGRPSVLRRGKRNDKRQQTELMQPALLRPAAAQDRL
jgi:hypothetical protein